MKIQHIFCLPRSYSMNTNTQVCFSLDDDDMHAISDRSSVKEHYRGEAKCWSEDRLSAVVTFYLPLKAHSIGLILL